MSKYDSGVRCRCDGASVSMTFISNNTSAWEVQTPRMRPQSWTIYFGVSLFDYPVLVHVQPDSILEQPYPHSPRQSRTSLCHWMTRPPVLRSNACCSVKFALHPSHLIGIQVAVDIDTNRRRSTPSLSTGNGINSSNRTL